MTRHTLVVRPRGALLVGGGGALTPHLDVAQVRDDDGVPHIPATALRGAIREQAERLAREAGADVSSLFGEPGRAARVRIGDAVIPPALDATRDAFARGEGYTVRHGATRTRETGQCLPDAHYRREAIDGGAADLRFEATVDVDTLDPAAERLLRGAVHAVHAIGFGRSGGLGAVALTLESAPPATPTAPAIPEHDAITITLRAEEPIVIDADSRGAAAIPAPVLRAALIAAVARARGTDPRHDLADDDAVRPVAFDAATCLRIGDASTAAPRAHTTVVCTQCPADPPALDTLVRDFVAGRIADAGGRVRLDARCPRCGTAPSTDGAAPHGDAARRRLVATQGIDRVRGTPGAPVVRTAFDRGTRFVARIGRIDDAGRAFLRDAASVGLRVGRGRNRGFGHVAIESCAVVDDTPLAERLAAFDRATRDAIDGAAGTCGVAEAAPPLGRSFVAVTASTDVIVAGDATDAESAWLAALGLDGATIGAGSVRTTRTTGYDGFRNRQKPVRTAITAGSVLLLELDASLESLVDALAARERDGIGDVREEGFGAIRFSDATHRPGWRTTT